MISAECTANDRKLAYLLLRLIMGVNICVHGFARIANGSRAFGHELIPMFATTFLPTWSVYLFGISLPWAELLVGAVVVLGWKGRYAYLLGMSMILALTFGSSLRQDWAAATMQLTYALLYGALLAFRSYNVFSIDGWFHGSSARIKLQRSS